MNIKNTYSQRTKTGGNALVGVIIIIIILILGGIYIWRSNVKTEVPQEEVTPDQVVADELIGDLELEEITSDIEGIEADLQLSDFDELDLGVDDLGI